jgi:hypothetical protein
LKGFFLNEKQKIGKTGIKLATRSSIAALLLDNEAIDEILDADPVQ